MLLPLLALQGLIKVRGDRCWRDLTCMDFHYEVRSGDVLTQTSAHWTPLPASFV